MNLDDQPASGPDYERFRERIAEVLIAEAGSLGGMVAWKCWEELGDPAKASPRRREDCLKTMIDGAIYDRTKRRGLFDLLRDIAESEGIELPKERIKVRGDP